MNKLQIERRLRRLEETVGVKSNLREARQIMNIGGYDEEEMFDKILIPLFNSWGLNLTKDFPEFYDGAYFLDLTDKAQVETPGAYDPEDTFFIDVQKFATLVTKHFVKKGIIGREFLSKKLPQFNIAKLNELDRKNFMERVQELPIFGKILALGLKRIRYTQTDETCWFRRDLEDNKRLEFTISIYTQSKKKFGMQVALEQFDDLGYNTFQPNFRKGYLMSYSIAEVEEKLEKIYGVIKMLINDPSKKYPISLATD